MLVEFKTVRSNWHEQKEKEDAIAMGQARESDYNEKDYYAPIVLEMDDARDYNCGSALVNDEVLQCVYVRMGGPESDLYSPALIIRWGDFRIIWDSIVRKPIMKSKEILQNVTED